jgi:hypothetical protein
MTVGCASPGESLDTAAHQNTRPTTAARSITPRSAASNRSSRAVSSAWMVGGIVMRERSRVAIHRPSSSVSTPSSMSMRSVCSTNSGLPSATSAIRARASPANSAPPTRPWISPSICAAVSGCSVISVALSLGVTHSGRTSRSSGRARHRKSTGAVLIQSARYSSRSRNVGSPHWMSSKTTTSGRCVPRCSKSLRTAQNVSWMPA